MKIWRLGVILLGVIILVGATACNPFSNNKEAGQQYEVRRGDLTVKVNGNGKTTAAETASLTFGINGQIEEIKAKEGDAVAKGDTLARLATRSLELALSQAEVNRAQAELAFAQAETGKVQAEFALSQSEVASSQAALAVEAAIFELDRMKDVQEIKDDIEDAEWEVKIAEMKMKEAAQYQDAGGIVGYWAGMVAAARMKVAEYQRDLAELLGKDEYATLVVDEVKIKALKVSAAEKSLEQAQKGVEQARKNLEQAGKMVEASTVSVVYATKAVSYARQQLEEAIITAPFDGMIIDVNAEVGDMVPSAQSTKPVIYMINPASIEIEAEIDEIDVSRVKPEQKVTIKMDASPGSQVEGTVKQISMVPAPKSTGIVAYNVKVALTSQPDFQVRVGMSASVDITIDEHKDVLLVPNKAIERDAQKNAYVKVLVKEKTERLPVVTGMTDGIDTEILQGLEAGNMLVVATTKPNKS